MRLIGLTGGIASGKSTVAALLQEFGAPVVDADALAHRVMAPGTPVLREVRGAFPDAFDEEGGLDRSRLAEIVFHDEARRMTLNGIVHPRVRSLMNEAVSAARKRGERACVLDVPLLIESGLHKTVDEVWLVLVSEETQIKRLIERNRLSRDEALARIRAQMPLNEKVRYASAVIDNEGPIPVLRERVRSLWFQAVGKTES